MVLVPTNNLGGKAMCVLNIKNFFQCIIEEKVNRFVVKVRKNKGTYLAHNTNTGRLEGLLIKGRKALCKPLKNPSKTSFRLFAVEMDGGYAVIDTTLQEATFKKAVEKEAISYLKGCSLIKRSPRIGNSTFDFLLDCGGKRIIVETKSAVLRSEDGFGMYPDCPTERGRRHIRELIKLAREGYTTLLLFIVAFPNAKGFKPYKKGDPELYELLKGFIPDKMMVKSIGIDFDVKSSCVRLYSDDLKVVLQP